ncbi:pseudouridine synthase [Fusobacterium necrophorum subsp. funduliforme 1_1_36S]|nr:pseudouridine synthase [Fusobacterium necrophorum subsp. funduliforme 1_1_36S]
MLRKIITEEAIEQLRQGVRIGDYTTLPAQVEQLEEQKISLTIQEGKFHQVKKMLEAVDNKVSYLKRVSFGRLILGDLKPGEVREVSLEDIIFLNTK